MFNRCVIHQPAVAVNAPFAGWFRRGGRAGGSLLSPAFSATSMWRRGRAGKTFVFRSKGGIRIKNAAGKRVAKARNLCRIVRDFSSKTSFVRKQL
jgi:hypothetical protein